MVEPDLYDDYCALPVWAQVMITLFVIVPIRVLGIIAAPAFYIWRKIRRGGRCVHAGASPVS